MQKVLATWASTDELNTNLDIEAWAKHKLGQVQKWKKKEKKGKNWTEKS